MTDERRKYLHTLAHLKRRIHAAQSLDDLSDIIETVADEYKESAELINVAMLKKLELTGEK